MKPTLSENPRTLPAMPQAETSSSGVKGPGVGLKKGNKMKNELANKTQDLPVGNSPAEMIRMAVTGGADLEKLEKLLSLQERWEANEARKAYHEAMAAFKANPPKIEKDKTVGYDVRTGGKVGYKHASLYNVTEKINTALSQYGLSASWRVAQNGQISVTTRIAHIQGHYEETTLTAPADESGSKNKIQALGSTVTYLERYGLLALTGLATHDQDDDGRLAQSDEVIDQAQLNTLLDYIGATQTNIDKFLTYMKIEKLEEMPKRLYQKAFSALKAKEAKK